MTATAVDRNTVQLGTLPVPGALTAPIAASTKIYQGTLVGINTSGYAVPASALPALRIVGVADKKYDNSSGAASALTVTAKPGAYWFINGGDITDDHIGRVCYAADDQTVYLASGPTATPGTYPIAGRIVGYDATLGVCVQVGAGTGDMMLITSTFDHADTDLNVAATSATRTISGTLPIGAVIDKIEIDTTQDYSDGSTGTFAVTIGDGTTADLYATDAGNIDNGTSRTQYRGVGAARIKTATAIVVTVTGSVNLNTATGGTFIVYIWLRLP